MFIQLLIVSMISVSVYSQNELSQCLMNECGITLEHSIRAQCFFNVSDCKGFLGDSFTQCQASLCVLSCRMSLKRVQRECQKKCIYEHLDDQYHYCYHYTTNYPNNDNNTNNDRDNSKNEQILQESQNEEHQPWVIPVLICSFAVTVIVLIVFLIKNIMIRRKLEKNQIQSNSQDNINQFPSPQQQENIKNQSLDIIYQGTVEEKNENSLNRNVKEHNQQTQYPKLQQIYLKQNEIPQENLDRLYPPIQNNEINNQIQYQETPNN